MKKTAFAALLALALLPAASFAQVVIRIGPPAPVVEHYGPPPHEGWVWQPGFHEYVNGAYVWRPGHWARPPYPGAVWVPHHYVRRDGGWVLIRGHWRR